MSSRSNRDRYRRSRSRSPFRGSRKPQHSRSPAGRRYDGPSKSLYSHSSSRPNFRQLSRSPPPRNRRPSPPKRLSPERSRRRESHDSQRRSPGAQQVLYREDRRSHEMDTAGQEKVLHVDHTRVKTKTGQRKKMLTERFGVNVKKYHLEENITIGLQRNPHAPISNVVNVETSSFDFRNFKLIRQDDEGSKPIFDREEIKAFRHDENLDDDDEFERRVITVNPSKVSHRDRGRQGDGAFSRRMAMSSFDSRQEDARYTDGGDDDDERWVKSRSEPKVRLDPRPDPRYEAKFQASRDNDDDDLPFHKMERFDRVRQNPRDLRHNLQRKVQDNPEMRDARFQIEVKRREHTDQSADIQERLHVDSRSHDHDRGDKPGQGQDAWEIANSHSRGREPVRRERSSEAARQPQPEWMNNPEMVPKGVSYFEHDNRDDMSSGGRGRGFGRGWGRGRGRGRGRGGFVPRGQGYGRGFRDHRPSDRSPRNRSRERSPVRGNRDRSYDNRNWDSSRGRKREYFDRGEGRERRRGGDMGAWKHDMFVKMEKEEDTQPSSTT